MAALLALARPLPSLFRHVSREYLDTALDLLRDGRLAATPMAFAEGLRKYDASRPRVETGCARGPNLAAVVLADLGYLTPPRPRSTAGR